MSHGGSMKKSKRPFNSPKIPLAEPPKPIKESANPLYPKKVLAEFRGYGVPYNLRKEPSVGDAPKIAGFKCMASWRVIHSDEKLLEFMELEDAMGNVHTLYHGTPASNIMAIAEEGLRPGSSSGMFGSGIYMGEPAKAFAYTRFNSFNLRRRVPNQNAAYMLRVQAVLGKVKECDHSEKWSLKRLQAEGFDSVAGYAGRTMGRYGTLRGSEWIVYSPTQVLVERIFEYQPTTDMDPYAYTPPSSGSCGILYPKPPAVLEAEAKGMSAFKDLISKKPCGKEAYRQVQVESTYVWVCNGCIENLRLKIGSWIEIFRPGYRTENTPVKLRIKSIKR